MSKGIFGNMFDFNRGGKLDIFEQAAEFSFIQKMMEADEEKEDSSDDDDECDISITLDFSIGSGDDDTDSDWRDRCYGDEIGIDPDDYDSEEEYLEAVDEKERWITMIPEKVSALAEEFCIEPEDYDSYEEFIDALKDEL